MWRPRCLSSCIYIIVLYVKEQLNLLCETKTDTKCVFSKDCLCLAGDKCLCMYVIRPDSQGSLGLQSDISTKLPSATQCSHVLINRLP